MTDVLVLDARYRNALAAIRNLGTNGIDVSAGHTNVLTAGAFSTHTSRRITYPDPRMDERGFLETIIDELATGDYEMILPITDATVYPVVRAKDRIERHATVPFLDYDHLEVGLDKAATAEAAAAADVATPETITDPNPARSVVDALGYPVVVKPRRRHGSIGVTVCESFSAFESAFERVRERHGQPIVQEFIPNGGEIGVYTVYTDETELRGVTVQRRLRSFPASGGTSTLRETVDRPDLRETADELFQSLDWSGVAMAEFRIDGRDGTPRLLEINPRFWGSLPLSVFAGIDFPTILYRLATEGDCPAQLDYAVGVRSRWFLGELLHLFDTSDRRAAIRSMFQQTDKPSRYDVFSKADPLPALGYFLNLPLELSNGRELSELVSKVVGKH